MTLREVVEKVIENSGVVQLARLDLDIAKIENASSDAEFDTFVSLSPAYQKKNQLSDYTYESFNTRVSTLSVSLGAKTKFHLGTTLEIAFQNLKQTTDAPTQFYHQYFQGALQLKAIQPLLKGFGFYVNSIFEKKAGLKLDRYQCELQEKTDTETLKAVEIYYDLFVAVGAIEIHKKTLETIAETYESDRSKFKVGKKSENDVLESKARLASFQAKLVLAESEEENLSEQLARLTLPADQSDIEVKPVENRSVIASPESPESESGFGSYDFSGIPRLRKSMIILQEAQYDHDRAVLESKPQLDLALEGRSAGLSTNFSNTQSAILRRDFPSWELSLQLKMPLFWDHAAKGALLQSRKALAQMEVKNSQEQLLWRNDLKTAFKEARDRSRKWENILLRMTDVEEKLRAKKSMYDAGKLSLLEFNDSMDEWNTLKLDELTEYAEMRKNYFKARSLTGKSRDLLN